MLLADTVKLPCVSGTIFGFEVVPEVWSTRAVSSAPRSPPFGVSPRVRGCREKSPASSWETRSIRGMPRLAAAAMAGEVLALPRSRLLCSDLPCRSEILLREKPGSRGRQYMLPKRPRRLPPSGGHWPGQLPPCRRGQGLLHSGFARFFRPVQRGRHRSENSVPVPQLQHLPSQPA